MSKRALLILATIVSALAIGVASLSTFLAVAGATTSVNTSCPAGTYLQGYGEQDEPICNAYPTGCPYADRIPVDSPKCVPPKTTITEQQPEITYEETTEVYGK